MKTLRKYWKNSAWRKGLADNPKVLSAGAGLIALWIRLVMRTSRVDAKGWDAVERALDAHGAVILVLWHQRLLLSHRCFDLSAGPFRSLTSNARPGRLVGIMLGKFGFDTMPMPHTAGSTTAMRTVLVNLRDGQSIGIAPDGPNGPAREVKATPIQWARVTGKPVVGFAFSARRYVTLPMWDRSMMPLPFNRITLRWDVWDHSVEGRLTPEQMDAAAQHMKGFLDRLTDECDLAVGHETPQR